MDERILKAANIIQKEKIANVILIGKKEEVLESCKNFKIDLNDNIQIINPKEYKRIDEFANKLYDIRKNKGMSLEEAKKLVLDYVYFGNMMLYFKEADGIVSGAIHSTADTLRPSLQIIKKRDDINFVSSFFIMETEKKELGSNGVFLFSDCGIIEEPNELQLQDIANSSVDSFRKIVGDIPKVAFLSYSTLGSAKGEKIDKIKRYCKKLTVML